MSILKNCLICNKIFKTENYYIKRGHGKFCSNKCCAIEKTFITNSPEYFWNNVDIRANINLCWIWKKGKNKSNNGYGENKHNKKRILAHRRAYFLAFPEQDIEENQQLSVLHICDTPLCCNPYHLKLGTHQENMQDRNNKKRHSYGEKHARSKLTENQVLEILQLKGKLLQTEIANIYNIDSRSICSIFNNKIWKHISRENFI